jgi:tryptophan synthase beta subunit
MNRGPRAREGRALGGDARVIVNLSGRGDKDVNEVLRVRGKAG